MVWGGASVNEGRGTSGPPNSTGAAACIFEGGDRLMEPRVTGRESSAGLGETKRGERMPRNDSSRGRRSPASAAYNWSTFLEVSRLCLRKLAGGA
jgi:hypothetical protein